MSFRPPKDTEKISWTRHAWEKMKFYRLSESHLKRILRHPKRTEKGIAPKTIACMQPSDSRKHPTEIWLMYQIINQKFYPERSRSAKIKNQKIKEKIRIISAWRYPGVSPIGEPIFIPEDVLNELERLTKK